MDDIVVGGLCVKCRHCRADIEETYVEDIYLHVEWRRRVGKPVKIVWIYCKALERPQWGPELLRAEP